MDTPKVNAQIARLLCELRKEEFKPLVDYLKDRRQATLEDLAKVEKVEVLYRKQGESAVLADLLKLIADSETLFAKLKNYTYI